MDQYFSKDTLYYGNVLADCCHFLTEKRKQTMEIFESLKNYRGLAEIYAHMAAESPQKDIGNFIIVRKILLLLVSNNWEIIFYYNSVLL